MSMFMGIAIIVLIVMVLDHRAKLKTYAKQLTLLQDELNRLYDKLQKHPHTTIAPQPTDTTDIDAPDVASDITPHQVHQDAPTLAIDLEVTNPDTPNTSDTPDVSPITAPPSHPLTPDTKPTSKRPPIRAKLTDLPYARPASHPRPQKIPRPSAIKPVLMWFITGNVVLKIGVVVLFLGLAFLLKLASHYIETPLWLRYLAVGVFGLIATGVGIYLTKKRREYGLILQGFGLAVMYLTTLASLKMAHLISPTTAFVLMVVVVVAKIGLSLHQNAKILAQIALIGGLATPLLTTTGDNNYLALFVYLALLNTGVALIASTRAWRILNVISMVGTFGITLMWQMGLDLPTQQSARMASVAFGVYHIILYGYCVSAYARHQIDTPQADSLPNDAPLHAILTSYLKSGQYAGKVDASVLFGSALAGFVFLYQALADMGGNATMFMAWGLACLYGVFALMNQHKDTLTLSHALWLLSGIFVSLGIGLGFDGKLAIGLWALQAGLVYGFGVYQRAVQARCFALLLFVMAGVLWFGEYQVSFNEHILTGDGYGTLWQVLAGVIVYGLWQRHQGEKHSAKWEINAQHIGLALTLTHAMILPSLYLSATSTAWVMMGYLVALGVWLYHRRISTVALFAPIISVWTLCYATMASAQVNEFIFIGTGIGMLILAGGLHLSQWQTPNTPRALYQFCGVLVLLLGFIGLVAGFADGLDGFDVLSDDTHLLLLWAVWASFATFVIALYLSRLISTHHWRALALISLMALPVLALGIGKYALDDGVTLALSLLTAVSIILSLVALHAQKCSHDTTSKLHLSQLAIIVMLTSLLLHQSPKDSLSHLWGVASLAIWALITYAPFAPITRYRHAYQRWGALLCFGFVGVWCVYVAFCTPMVIGSRLPLLNAVDMLHVVAVWLFVKMLKNTHSAHQPILIPIGASLLWLIISALVVRTWYFYGEVAWYFGTLFANFAIQSSLSLMWSAMGIALMVMGNKTKQRALWLVGATLLGVVVIKLFLVDLGDSGGVARIVSFIGVGIGLLLVGWFAPVPPKRD